MKKTALTCGGVNSSAAMVKARHASMQDCHARARHCIGCRIKRTLGKQNYGGVEMLRGAVEV